MGDGGAALRISHSVHVHTTFSLRTHSVSVIPSQHGTFRGSGCRDCRYGEEAGNRGSSGSRPRLLQSDVRGAQSLRRIQARDRSKPPEQVHQPVKVQDGNAQDGPFIDQERRLDGLDRLEGRLFSHTHPSRLQEVSTLRVEGEGMAVQVPMFRSFDSTSGVHQGDGTSSRGSTSGRLQGAEILGRLVDSARRRDRNSSGEGQDAFLVRSLGTPSESKEISTDTDEHHYVPGYGDTFGTDDGFPDAGQSGQNEEDIVTVLEGQQSPGRSLAKTVGSFVLAGKVGTRRQAQDESSAILFKRSLVEVSRQRPQSEAVAGGSSRLGVVECRREHLEGAESSGCKSRIHSLHRRFEYRLGRCDAGSRSLRRVVGGRKGFAHQRVGTESCATRSRDLCARSKREGLNADGRQLYCPSVYKKSGRNEIQSAVSGGTGAIWMAGRERGVPSDGIHSGKEECTGGSTKSGRSDLPSRMDSASRCLQGDLANLGNTDDRCLCDEVDSQASTVLFSDEGRRGFSGGCSSTELGRSLPVCIPTIHLDPESFVETQGIAQHEDDPDSSQVVDTALVRGASTSHHGPSEESSTLEVATQTTEVGALPLQSIRARTSRVETIERLVRAQGFSRRVARRISNPLRESSATIYQSRWAVFCGWCRRRKTSPLSASLQLLADFFVHLRESKKLSFTAILGYRSALSQVFCHRGLDLVDNPVMRALFKNFRKEVPKRTIPLPRWNVNVVLCWLASDEFEPLERISIERLLWKSIFLLALASAKRVGELHALSAEIGFSNSTGSLLLSYVPEFMAKTDSATQRVPRSFTIPALEELVGNDEAELRLCPVRTLREYVRRLRPLRDGCPRLFVSLRDPSRPLAKNSISAFLRKVIIRAHRDCREEELAALRVKAHELRAVATSLRFKKNLVLQEVMEAAVWRCNSTFVSFYLRDISHEFLDVSSLGPVVAAQAVV